MEYFCQIPCGSSLPRNNPHAVSVHFPAIDDVIAYEENDPLINSKMESAYPRFRMNRLLAQAAEIVKGELKAAENSELIPVASEASIELLKKISGVDIKVVSYDGLHFALIKNNAPYLEAIKYFIRHTGIIPSSRKAEDFLLKRGIIKEEFAEDKSSNDEAESIIKNVMSEAYSFSDSSDVILCSAGMNAIYSLFESIKKVQSRKNNNIFIQAGWLYLDTMEILKKYSNSVFQYFNPLELDTLEQYIEANKDNIAALFTEIPNNPSIRCFDLRRLSEITRKYNIPLVVDSTLATPFTVDIFPYADIAVESLTKFACGHGDVLMGGIIINNASPWAELRDGIISLAEAPYIKDMRRLAFEIQSYKERMETVSENTFQLAEYFYTKPQIKSISWALDEKSKCIFLKIRKNEKALPGLISIAFDKHLKNYFDKLSLAKGPSLGTNFTLAMPYVYLAHYDLLTSAEGKKLLEINELNPEMLRISIGLEKAGDIISVFDEALK